MLALTILAATLLIAAGVGFAAYHIPSRYLQARWARTLVSVVSGALVLTLAAGVFLYFELTTPANDSARFQGQQRLRVTLRREPAGAQNVAADAFQVEIAAPDSVRVNQDFAFRLAVFPRSAGIPVPPVRAILSSPASARSRTLDSCAQPVSNPPDGAVSACSDRSGTSRRSVTWDVTPSQAGSIGLAVVLVDAGLVDPSKPWHATLAVNDQEIFLRKTDRHIGPRQVGSGGSRMDVWEPFYLTPEHPAAHVSGFDVDLSSMQLRVPVDVELTLGLSERAYDYVALIGTALAGALGTGWLWKLVEMWRARKGKRTPKKRSG